MDDVIYRRAAIDAINQICPIETEYDCTLLDRVDVRCVLTDLPSAQPEIIRCKDCIYFDRYADGIEKYQWDGFCADWARNTYEDWFCSRAERKGEQP